MRVFRSLIWIAVRLLKVKRYQPRRKYKLYFQDISVPTFLKNYRLCLWSDPYYRIYYNMTNFNNSFF